MRVCVPLMATDTPGGSVADAQLAGHFGLADRFAVIDSETCTIVAECASAGRCKGSCACSLSSLDRHGIEALAGQALGFRLLQMSRRAGLSVLETRTTQLRALPAAMCFKNGRSRLGNRA